MFRRPAVTVSYAQSLDGRIATSTGESQWISGPETLELAQQLRRDSDAILVGVQTVIRDDPSLTCRLPGCVSPLRVILDSSLRIPLESEVVSTSGDPPTLVLHTGDVPELRVRALSARGVETREVPADQRGRPDPAGVLETLGGVGCRTVLVEGGGAVITSFLRAGVVDRLVVVVAPMIIGRGIDAVGDLETARLADALRPEGLSVRRLGADMVWEMDMRRRSNCAGGSLVPVES